MIQRHRHKLSIPTILIVVFLAIQIAIPAAALSLPRPARFSWQMYAGVRTKADFTIVRNDGSEHEIELSDYLGNPRLDIDVTASLPAFICLNEPDVALVRIDELLSDKVTEHRCEP